MAFYPCTITLWKAMPQILPTDGGTWKAGWGGICRGRFLKSRISASGGRMPKSWFAQRLFRPTDVIEG